MNRRFYEKSLGNLLNEYARKELPKQGVKLGSNTGSSPILQLTNVLIQTIPRASRSVVEASTLTVPTSVESGYSELKQAIERGEDLTPYQGRKTNGRKYAEFTDFLKGNYGLDHFHLGGKDSRGRVGRTGLIALVYVTNYKAYVVDIVQHSKSLPDPWWTKKYLMTMHQEWPDVISPWLVPGLSLSYSPDEKAIEELSKAAVNTMFDLGDGIIYGQIGGGFVANGILRTAVNELNRLMLSIEPLHNSFVEYLRELDEIVSDFQLLTVSTDTLTYRHREMDIDFIASSVRISNTYKKPALFYINTNGRPEHYVTHADLHLNEITALILAKMRVKD